MKRLLGIALLVCSFASQAEVIDCGFTEPFVSFSYNTATETLVEHEAVMDKKRTMKNVSFQIKYAGTFLLKSKGKLVAELKLNNQGTDGMSDAIYPYQATYYGSVAGRPIEGGCTSSLKPMVKEAE